MMKTLLLVILCLVERNIAFHLSDVSSATRRCKESAMSVKYQNMLDIKSSALRSSTLGDDEKDDKQKSLKDPKDLQNPSNDDSIIEKLINGVPFLQLFQPDGYKKLPPMQVEDMNVLFYDVFLIVNLIVSISFWVTHRMSLEFLPSAFSEASLFSLLWIGSGLYHGSFLMSSVDGHFGSTDERGGPGAAASLALNTFVGAVNFRLVFALAVAVLQHRQVGTDPGEQLLPLEIGFGLILMTGWRALHSSITPRI